MKIQPVRGTHDIYGDNLISYKFIEKTIESLANIYDYKEIITPIFENADLFKKPLGENSDVVLKEMYTFKDLNESFLTLRPEYTTPIIRAAISNNLLDKLPVKIYGFGPMFRRERPQRGRFRQFNQINVELFGSSDVFSDLEIILLADEFLKKVINKDNYKLYINSLGDKDTLKKYKEVLSNYFDKYVSDLSQESKIKIKSNPLRILDSKDKNDIEIGKNSPKIETLYSTEARNTFDQVQSLLLKYGVKYTVDQNLVRGLDYYCSTVFEFKSNKGEYRDTLIGGGRYDGLIKMLGGPDIPGIGWAGGVERIVNLSKTISESLSLAHVVILDEKFKDFGFEIIDYLRKKNLKISFDYKFNLKKSLSNANENKSKFAIIIGEDEFKEKKYSIKNLLDGNQQKMTLEEIFKFLSI